MKKLIRVSSLAAVLTAAVPTLQAETIFGLSTTNSLFSFDSASPGTVSLPVSITGVTTGSIVDIDFSPVAFTLYGIASNGDLYSLNTTTGQAILKIGVSSQIAPNTITAPTAMDFNPAADRIRIFQGTSNFRLTGDAATYDSVQTAGTVTSDQTVAYISGGSGSPNLVAAAYINNFNGTATTALFSIDTATNNLVSHTSRASGPPAGNFSDLTQVGSSFAVDFGSNVGFDISGNQGSATGFVSDGNTFYTINLSTGALSSPSTIAVVGATTKSIAAAAVPEPTTTALSALGLLGLLARHRKA